ncbi:MAG: hypothetical protein NVS9B1_14780 [Candidatus Dormibacteraceae bacterium]
MPPLGGPAVSADVARQALLAGCQPGQLGVVLAAIVALQHPDFNSLGVLTTTGSAACAAVVNGPVIGRLGFSGGANCLGPNASANAAVGRAIGFVTRVLGRSIPGLIDMATTGQPGKYTFCFAENEAASPWPPLAVERGIAAGQSALTLFPAAGTIEVVNTFEEDVDELLDTLAATLAAPSSVGRSGSKVTVGGGQPMVLVSPEWAEICRREGLDKRDFKAQLWERARCPVERLPRRLREAVAQRRREDGDDPAADLPVAALAADILVVVAGGVGVKQTVIPSWSGGARAVTVPIGGD